VRPSDDPGERLLPLAERIVRSATVRGVTPVLVVPVFLTLRPAFFGALGMAIERVLGDQNPFAGVRIDHLVAARRWSHWFAGRGDGASGTVRIERTLTLGRQGGMSNELIVGYADVRAELPAWATPIRLAERPGVFLAGSAA